MGTTLVAALETRRNDVAIASVGDSRAYLYEAESCARSRKTRPGYRKWAARWGWMKRVCETHPMRHVLTMAVGVGTAVRIRYYAVPLEPDHL